MANWQYRVFVNAGDDTPEIQEALDFLGREGWELVTVETLGEAGDSSTRLYLKRPATESD